MTVVGDVHGKISLMIVSITVTCKFWSCDSHVIQDDVIDDLDHLIAAAKCLKERGSYRVCVVATHGIFTKTATELLEHSEIDEVFNVYTLPIKDTENPLTLPPPDNKHLIQCAITMEPSILNREHLK